jgi:hypothetical protein
MDHAWYGSVAPGGVLSDEDDAHVRDGPFEISLVRGVLMVEFDDAARKAEGRDLGSSYVAELALSRGRALTWSPHFRSTTASVTTHEATFGARLRFGVQLGKTITLPDGTQQVVRADSIDRLALPCIRANANLREIQRHLATSLEDPQHEHLQRAHDRLRDEIGQRTGRTSQGDQDRELGALVGEAPAWVGDIGQSLAATRHVIGAPPWCRGSPSLKLRHVFSASTPLQSRRGAARRRQALAATCAFGAWSRVVSRTADGDGGRESYGTGPSRASQDAEANCANRMQ